MGPLAPGAIGSGFGQRLERDPLVLLQSGVRQRYTETSGPTTPSSSIRKTGARGGSRTHMRKNPRRILSPQRLPFRHPGIGNTNLTNRKTECNTTCSPAVCTKTVVPAVVSVELSCGVSNRFTQSLRQPAIVLEQAQPPWSPGLWVVSRVEGAGTGKPSDSRNRSFPKEAPFGARNPVPSARIFLAIQ
jgi:hypothetical protein